MVGGSGNKGSSSKVSGGGGDVGCSRDGGGV